MHATYYILASTPAGALFEPVEILALLLAGLCHDVDHTGRNNAFEINKGTDLAILYHDVSVLEQHHAATAFFILNNPKYNILSRIGLEDRKTIRKLMIDSILATDMSKHFPMIAELTARFSAL
jgi:cAMP-specific phosphodiesterase 4